eukprot:gene16847-34980_t
MCTHVPDLEWSTTTATSSSSSSTSTSTSNTHATTTPVTSVSVSVSTRDVDITENTTNTNTQQEEVDNTCITSTSTSTSTSDTTTTSSTSISAEQTQHNIDMRSTYQSCGILVEEMTVLDPNTMEKVLANGAMLGEVMIRGNIVMKGYLDNEKATEESFAHGYFHTGDLAVLHPNNRIELKDRSKDIIISGGENISSIEVENILITHNEIIEVAVVALEDALWGEVPCAFIVLKSESTLTSESLTIWAKKKMSGFKVPKRIHICDTLPKTVTGK